jgi:uncharacterized protein
VLEETDIDLPAPSPLEDLIDRAHVAVLVMGTGNPHRKLLCDLSIALVAQAQQIAALQQQTADKPRIVLP